MKNVLDVQKGRLSACNDMVDEVVDMINTAENDFEIEVLNAVLRRLEEYTDIEDSILVRMEKKAAK